MELGAQACKTGEARRGSLAIPDDAGFPSDCGVWQGGLRLCHVRDACLLAIEACFQGGTSTFVGMPAAIGSRGVWERGEEGVSSSTADVRASRKRKTWTSGQVDPCLSYAVYSVAIPIKLLRPI